MKPLIQLEHRWRIPNLLSEKLKFICFIHITKTNTYKYPPWNEHFRPCKLMAKEDDSCLFGDVPFSVRVPIRWYWLVPNQRHLATEIHQCLKLVSGGLNLSLDGVKIGRSIVFRTNTHRFQRKCEQKSKVNWCFQIRPQWKKAHIDGPGSFPPKLLVETDKKHQLSSNFLREQKHQEKQRLPTTSWVSGLHDVGGIAVPLHVFPLEM